MGRRLYAVRAQRCYAALQSHENTRFLAAGLPLVSTPILDVVRTYGKAGLVRIAATAADFVLEIEGALRESRVDWIRRVDARLAMCSWDYTWRSMVNDIRSIGLGFENKKRPRPKRSHAVVDRCRPGRTRHETATIV
jgi:hypothetical protein